MRSNAMGRGWPALAAVLGLLLLAPGSAFAHCDTLDGPVVAAARRALDAGNVNPALVWVQEKDAPEIRSLFQKTVAVRKAGGQSKELADMYFFETLVRVHRAGEGAGYTGLKPAGRIEPPVAAADRSLETGKLQEVAKLVSQRVETGLHRRFEDVMKKRKYDPDDVAAGRAYVGAYVAYTHYVEGVYNAAGVAAPQKAGAAPVHAH